MTRIQYLYRMSNGKKLELIRLDPTEHGPESQERGAVELITYILNNRCVRIQKFIAFCLNSVSAGKLETTNNLWRFTTWLENST